MSALEQRTEQPAASTTGHSMGMHLLLAVTVILTGCGRQGGMHTSGTGPAPAQDAAAGGGGSNDRGGNPGPSSATAGGSVATDGGASRETVDALGGASSGGSAGASSTGGAAGSGGVTSRGGSVGASGGMSGGGSPASQVGGAVSSGGAGGATTSSVGGGSGGSASAGSSTGGVIASGGVTSRGGSGGASTGASGGQNEGDPDGGIVASGYCSGSSPKVTYLGQTVPAPATNYQSSLGFSCCRTFGVNLHTSASLALDFQVEVITPEGIQPGDYDVTATTYRVRAPVRTSHEAAKPYTYNTGGTVRIDSAPSATQAWALGLCLEVDDPSSALLGTRIYVPSVTMTPYSQWNERFQIYLLQDPSTTVLNAAAVALDSLVLAAQSLLDLSGIAYVEQATTRIGLNPGQKLGDSIRSQLGTPLELPFVAVADGVPIYLGTFTSLISSIPTVGPFVSVEGITSDGFVIQPPSSGADPRNDAGILQILTEAGKLVP